MFKDQKYRIKIGYLASIFLYITSGIMLTTLPLLIAESGQSPYALISRLSAAVVIGLGAVAVQLISYKEAMELKIDQNSSGPFVKFVGDSDKAASEILKKIKNAKNVNNTFIGIRQANSKKAAELYEAWITNRNAEEWVDVVGPAQIFDERYMLVNLDSQKIIGSHSIYIVRHSTPIVNFIIMDYPSDNNTSEYDNSEVYFGWISSEGHSQRIFSSTDRIVVNTFRNYFRALKSHRLWGSPVAVDYKESTFARRISKNYLVDKVGAWLTLSISKNEVTTYGLFNIDITKKQSEAKKSGVIEIKGIVLNKNLQLISKIDHNENNISHYQNKIFIEYGENPDTNRAGFCFYEFKRHAILGEFEEVDAVNGFFIDEGHWEKNLIFGKKTSLYNCSLNSIEYKKMAVDALDYALNTQKISRDMYEKAKLELI